jgi:hypothetical protein
MFASLSCHADVELSASANGGTWERESLARKGGVMTNDSAVRAITIIGDHWGEIALYASTNYDLEGRAVIHVGFPNVPPGHTALGITMMKYITLDDLRRITNPAEKDWANLARMVETYDPEQQSVVIGAIEGEPSISIKMKLERPSSSTRQTVSTESAL